MVLMSNSPARKIVGLEGYGLKVVGHRSLNPNDAGIQKP
jgi:GTP cyclohydrolase II